MNHFNPTNASRPVLWRQTVAVALAATGLALSACNQQTPEAAAPAADAGKAVQPAPAAASHTPAPAPAAKAPSHTATAAPAAAPAQRKAAAPVCTDCATVVSVTPVEREGSGSGAGAIVGGLVGAALGHQVGQGQGKDLATVAGAIGGGFAGNAIEKNMKKTTVFQIALRMDDGSQRSMELGDAGALKAGARVRVEGPNLVALPAGK